MELRYQETKSDFIRWHRLNKTGVTQQWKSYLLVAAVLLPSVVVLITLKSTFFALFMSIATVVMLGTSVFRYFVPLMRVPVSQRVDVFHRDMATRTVSKSVTQWKWERIEEYQETRKEFQFWRLDIASVVPKRALSGDQQEELRNLLTEVQQHPAGDSPPLPLFADRLLEARGYPVYRYQMTSEDARKILSSKLRPYRSSDAPSNPQSVSPRKSFRLARIFFVLYFIGVGLLVMLSGGTIQNFSRDLLICLMPFLLLWLLVRLRLQFRITRLFKLPSDEISFRLCDDGIVMGTSDYVSLVHWSDVSDFYDSEYYIGLQTIHLLIQILPKRAIGGDAEVERLLDTAIELKAVADRDAIAVIQVKPIHSDNPYQAPSSS